MSYSGTMTRSWTDGDGPLTATESFSADDVQKVTLGPIASPSTGTAFTLALNHSKVVALVVKVDQVMTVHFLTSGSPITITNLQPDCPYVITPHSPNASLLTSDVLSGTIDNSSGAAGNLVVRAYYNN